MKNTLHFNIMLIVSMSFVLIFSLCKKGEKLYTSAATLYNSGPPAADGCGWFFRVDSATEYSATNLSDAFKLHGSKVIIRYRVLDSKFLCGWGAKLQQIELVDIRVKDTDLAQTDATVIDAGKPEADGCGWLIKVDTSYYHPQYELPVKYKKDNLKVKIAYDLLPVKYQCGIAANLKYSQINIKAIKER